MHQQPFCLGYVGRLAEDQKLVRDLPNIIKQLEVIGVSVKLLIAGTGPEEQWLRREFAGRIKDLSVEFLGAIKFKDMKDTVYARTDALIVTSSWETGPIVIWEAMASGVPVVTSRYLGSGLENSLVNGENCLMFQPGDVTAAAACIKRIIDENLTAKLITGGYQLVARKYSHAISVDAWERCFRQILAAPVKCDANNTLPMVAPSGRLDAVFGTGLGETIRSKIGKIYVHKSPGSEWPHSYGIRGHRDGSFWSLAKRLDETSGRYSVECA
jgi:glycogen synthase